MVGPGYSTTRAGVFAAGDAVIGPSTVVQAIGQGNEVAEAVDHYLRTGKVEEVAVQPGYEVVKQIFDMEQYYKAVRPATPEVPVEDRRGNFREVELCFDERTAQEECKRCLRCDLEWLEDTGLEAVPVPDRLLVIETAEKRA